MLKDYFLSNVFQCQKSGEKTLHFTKDILKFLNKTMKLYLNVFTLKRWLKKCTFFYKLKYETGNESVLDMAKICPLRHDEKVMRIVLPKKCEWKENDSCHRHFAFVKSRVHFVNGKFGLPFCIDLKVCCSNFSIKVKLQGLLLNKMFHSYFLSFSAN